LTSQNIAFISIYSQKLKFPFLLTAKIIKHQIFFSSEVVSGKIKIAIVPNRDVFNAWKKKKFSMPPIEEEFITISLIFCFYWRSLASLKIGSILVFPLGKATLTCQNKHPAHIFACGIQRERTT